jgi:hypothetical protein
VRTDGLAVGEVAGITTETRTRTLDRRDFARLLSSIGADPG